MAEQTEMNYFAKFGLDNSDFLSGMTSMAISFDAIMMAGQLAFSTIEKGYEATVGNMVNYADKIQKASDMTGVSVENIQRLSAAGLATGVSFDEASSELRMYTQRISDTGAAGETLRSRLAEIGVQAKDSEGNWKDMSQLMLETNAALNNMPSATERANLAVDIYGRSWYNIAPMIRDADTAAQAFSKSEPFNEKEIQEAHDYGVKLDLINAAFEKMERKVSVPIIDAISQSAFISGDWANTPLGMALGWKNPVSTEETTKPIDDVKAATTALYDKYSGYTRTELDLAIAKEDVAKAQEAVTGAKTQAEMDKYSLQLQTAKNHVDELREAMAKAGTASTTMATTMTGSWAGQSIIGAAGTEMSEFMQKEMKDGTDYQTALNNWMNGTPTTGGYGSKDTLAGQSQARSPKLNAKDKEQVDSAKLLSEEMLAQYIIQENYTKIHWMALSEMERIAVTDMSANWKKYVDFAAAFPTIHNIGIVIWEKGTPDWSPELNPVFMQAARRASLASQDLSFAKTDLSQVETNASKQKTDVKITVINEKDISSKFVDLSSQATALQIMTKGGN